MASCSDLSATLGYFARPVVDPQFPSFRFHGHTLQANGGSESNPTWFGRIDSAHLLDLLRTPIGQPPVVLTKKGKPRVRQPPPVKEQRPGFYPAQMMFYGVKPVRKNTPGAKSLLLHAFANLPAGAQLQVSPAVVSLEQRLKDLFTKVSAEEQRKCEEEFKRRQSLEAEERQKRQLREQEERQKCEQELVDAEKGFLSSRFDCFVPEINEQWPQDSSSTLRLAPSSTRTHLWGKFELGIVRGYLRAKPVTSRPRVFSFAWRGYVGEGGECSYIDDHNKGEIEFLDDGLINGWIKGDCFGRSKLMGKRTGPLCPSTLIQRFVTDWKEAFRSINEGEYQRANVARWGAWAPYPPPVKKDASDTDAGDSASDSGNDDDDDDHDGGEGWSAKRRAPTPSFAASTSVRGGMRTKQTARKSGTAVGPHNSLNLPQTYDLESSDKSSDRSSDKSLGDTGSDTEWIDRSADWRDGFEAGYKRGLRSRSGALE
ncbi:hypothetical protein HDU87_005546 [Geranomyces variabilis]|uniref:Uncharacterized protein n=1 Tax=Geranomyces variabilis TaxID=109894 RepID=A0AAD5XP12_9FUNG|nr:hypothetical protein HDU87_005546 [Geranomyces variabilis]